MRRSRRGIRIREAGSWPLYCQCCLIAYDFPLLPTCPDISACDCEQRQEVIVWARITGWGFKSTFGICALTLIRQKIQSWFAQLEFSLLQVWIQLLDKKDSNHSENFQTCYQPKLFQGSSRLIPNNESSVFCAHIVSGEERKKTRVDPIYCTKSSSNKRKEKNKQASMSIINNGGVLLISSINWTCCSRYAYDIQKKAFA